MAHPETVARDLPLFAGADYSTPRDQARLSAQYLRIYELMKDGRWRTLPEIGELAGAPEASASAQLRHMRKDRFGAHVVNRRYLGQGLYEYQLIVNRAVDTEREL